MLDNVPEQPVLTNADMRAFMTEHNLSQKKLSQLMGLDAKGVSLCVGKKAPPTKKLPPTYDLLLGLAYERLFHRVPLMADHPWLARDNYKLSTRELSLITAYCEQIRPYSAVLMMRQSAEMIEAVA